MITESWLSENIHDSAVEIGNNYNIFRPGGGVLAYVNKCIPVERITNLEEEGKEVLWLVLKPPWTPRPFSTITVIIVYYPPGQLRERENKIIEYLSNGLDELLHKRPSSGIIIAGDFNNLNLSRLCSRFSLRKTVSAPTRSKNTLDQIVTNMFNSCRSLRPSVYFPQTQIKAKCTPNNKKSETNETWKPDRFKYESGAGKLGGRTFCTRRWQKVQAFNDIVMCSMPELDSIHLTNRGLPAI